MKKWKTIAIIYVFLMLTISTLASGALALSEEINETNKQMKNDSTNIENDAEIDLASMYYYRLPFHYDQSIIHDGPQTVVRVACNSTIKIKINCHILDYRFIRKDNYDVNFSIHLSYDEGIEETDTVIIPSGVGQFKRDETDEISLVAPNSPKECKVPYILEIRGPFERNIVDGAFTIITVRHNEERTKSQITTSPLQPTPSANSVITTNPLISKLFETISEQINSYNSNVETTPSTTPNAQPNPSTTPAEEVQTEPADVSNIVNEEQETVNC
ncbi:MAG: hypothetical protein J7K13_02805 [Thermoplasmata archaeon]|nr:hypothetical protein [Thermoplasmata archaeon]